jgi:hypothetical protein
LKDVCQSDYDFHSLSLLSLVSSKWVLEVVSTVS